MVLKIIEREGQLNIQLRIDDLQKVLYSVFIWFPSCKEKCCSPLPVFCLFFGFLGVDDEANICNSFCLQAFSIIELIFCSYVLLLVLGWL